MSCRKRSSRPHRPGFTLVELLVAGTIIAFLLGTVSVSMSQIGQAKDIAKRRLDAHLRADAALNAIRRDVASVIRTDDLYFTRLLIEGREIRSPIGRLGRDEILVFNTQLRPVRDLDYTYGEGQEYETHYRVEEDDLGPMLWRRSDSVWDQFPRGGGLVTPRVECIVSLDFEAYDGVEWLDEWDSDFDGLPLAVRITVVASGCRDGEAPHESPLATLRTVVAVDRVFEPKDHLLAEQEEKAELVQAEIEQENAELGGGQQQPGAPGEPGEFGEGEVPPDELGGEAGRRGGDAPPRDAPPRRGGRGGQGGNQGRGGAAGQGTSGQRGGDDT